MIVCLLLSIICENLSTNKHLHSSLTFDTLIRIIASAYIFLLFGMLEYAFLLILCSCLPWFYAQYFRQMYMVLLSPYNHNICIYIAGNVVPIDLFFLK